MPWLSLGDYYALLEYSEICFLFPPRLRDGFRALFCLGCVTNEGEKVASIQCVPDTGSLISCYRSIKRAVEKVMIMVLLLLVMVGGDWHQAVSGCEEDLVERFSEHCKG